MADADAIRARGLAEAEGQRALSDALAANENVAQRLELERMRVSAQIEVGVAQAKAMGDAMGAMDFKLYGTPDTAQQLLRMIGMSDGLGALINNAPAPLKEIGGRLLERMLPNGNGHATPAASLPTINFDGMQPLIVEGSRIVTQHLPAAELSQLTVQNALEQTLLVASESERATLHKLQGMVMLMPHIANQPAATVLTLAISESHIVPQNNG